MKKKIKNNVAGVNGTFVSVVTGSSAALPCDIRPPSPRFLKMNTIFMIYIQGFIFNIHDIHTGFHIQYS